MVYGAIDGNIIELNQKILKDFELLKSRSEEAGYIGIVNAGKYVDNKLNNKYVKYCEPKV